MIDEVRCSEFEAKSLFQYGAGGVSNCRLIEVLRVAKL